jgi:hypothetical protein
MIEGNDVPEVCKQCSDSHWEEMATGYEVAYCFKYDRICDKAIKQCKRIIMVTCDECPRGGA